MPYLDSFLKKKLRMIPDFPKPGINFCDVTSWLQSSQCVQSLIKLSMDNFLKKEYTKLIAIEARGFLVGTMIAAHASVPLLLARKPNKLPVPTDSQEYSLEYGTDKICLEKGVITDEDRVLIVDDLLATGGTINAVADIVKKYNPQVVDSFVWIELTSEGLHGREFLREHGVDVSSILQL